MMIFNPQISPFTPSYVSDNGKYMINNYLSWHLVKKFHLYTNCLKFHLNTKKCGDNGLPTTVPLKCSPPACHRPKCKSRFGYHFGRLKWFVATCKQLALCCPTKRTNRLPLRPLRSTRVRPYICVISLLAMNFDNNCRSSCCLGKADRQRCWWNRSQCKNKKENCKYKSKNKSNDKHSDSGKTDKE